METNNYKVKFNIKKSIPLKRLIYIVIFILALPITSKAGDINIKEIKEGDLIFQISKSSQSTAIQVATVSPWSHCGIIVEKKGVFYVLEASNVVKLTPIQKWIDRGHMKIYAIKRVIEDDIKIHYKQYLGQKYDLAFKFNNNKMYCSELIYVIYKKQFDIEIAKPKKIKDYNTFFFKKMMKRRKMDLEQYAIAPSDLYEAL